MNAGLVKTSLVNFPGRIAAAVFLPGCNLRCPFCHNAELATASVVLGPRAQSETENEYVSLEDIYSHLERRASVLGGIAISGGEPLLSPALPDLIRKARSVNLAVKVDTNGTLPDRLKAIIEAPDLIPDMIAIDVKTSPARYGELTTESEAGPMAGQALLRSLEILERVRPRIRVEYRTVLVPGLVGEEELRVIASLLPNDADWELAAFVPGTCLDETMNDRDPYGPVETARLLSVATSIRPGARIR